MVVETVTGVGLEGSRMPKLRAAEGALKRHLLVESTIAPIATGAVLEAADEYAGRRNMKTARKTAARA